MLNIDRVWSRVSQRSAYRSAKLTDFMYQGYNYTTQLTTGQVVNNQPITFPAGAIILAVTAGAQITSVAATQQGRLGLDMFTLAIQQGWNQQQLVGPASSQGIASSVFGPYGDQFPAMEIVVPSSGTLMYSFTNLTTSTINIYLTHHVLQPGSPS